MPQEPQIYSVAGSLPTEAFASGGTAVLWVFFFASLLVTGYFVFAQLFHWLRFGFMYPLVWIAIPVYAMGIFVLLGAMLGGIGSL